MKTASSTEKTVFISIYYSDKSGIGTISGGRAVLILAASCLLGSDDNSNRKNETTKMSIPCLSFLSSR